MMTTGSDRGKCSAPQFGQRRDQPPRTMSLAWPQTEQWPWRRCQLARLSAQANKGASVSPSWASRPNAGTGGGSEGSDANRGASPSSPRNSVASLICPQTRRPSLSSAGSPSAQTSCLASSCAQSSARRSGWERTESAGSRPEPEKNGSGGKAGPVGEHRLGGAAVKRGQAGLGEPIERLPPTFTPRLRAGNYGQVEPEKWGG